MRELATMLERHALRTRLLLAVGGLLLSSGVVIGLAIQMVKLQLAARYAAGAAVPIAAPISPGWLWLIPAAAAVALVSAVVAVRVVWRVSGSLGAMRAAADRATAGQPEVSLAVDGDDEVGALARALHEMAASAAETYREVEEQNRNLERIVRLSTEELRHKNLALAFQNEKVNEANRLKSAFLASVSHELRTPLNAILALSEMLRDELSGPLSEEQVKQAAMIYRSGENLLHLINQVLDLSKIESGRMEIQRGPACIVDVLSDAANALRPLAEEKGLALDLELEGQGVEVLVDAAKLRQVFVNLLGNAIKFTERGTVRATVRLVQAESLLFAEVQDTGPGVAPEHQHLIFQEFQQVEPLAAGSKGTGLGLAISRRLINLLGGDIWVDSDRGKGARFAFVVPLSQPGEAEPAGEPRAEHTARPFPPHGQQRVLVVDEDVVEAGVLARYLRQQGLEVLTALDGPEALHIMRREPVDLVILDLLAAGEDAFRLVERMEEHPRLKPVPVVVNSSRPLSVEEVSFLKPRVQSIFYKGTRGVGDLIAEVAGALRGGAPEPGDIDTAGVGRLQDAA